MALNKPNIMSSVLADTNYTSDLAVDGDTRQDFPNGLCAATNVEPTAWWQVDLGAVYAISHVVVFNRDDCCGNILLFIPLLKEIDLNDNLSAVCFVLFS